MEMPFHYFLPLFSLLLFLAPMVSTLLAMPLDLRREGIAYWRITSRVGFSWEMIKDDCIVSRDSAKLLLASSPDTQHLNLIC